jgi:hypothetical protein
MANGLWLSADLLEIDPAAFVALVRDYEKNYVAELSAEEFQAIASSPPYREISPQMARIIFLPAEQGSIWLHLVLIILLVAGLITMEPQLLIPAAICNVIHLSIGFILFRNNRIVVSATAVKQTRTFGRTDTFPLQGISAARTYFWRIGNRRLPAPNTVSIAMYYENGQKGDISGFGMSPDKMVQLGAWLNTLADHRDEPE